MPNRQVNFQALFTFYRKQMHRSLYLFLFVYLLFQSCANQTQPTGGPKDEDPPQLIISIPENRAVNYTGQKIELTFNEAVQLKSAKSQILITPRIDVDYDIRMDLLQKNGFKSAKHFILTVFYRIYCRALIPGKLKTAGLTKGRKIPVAHSNISSSLIFKLVFLLPRYESSARE